MEPGLIDRDHPAKHWQGRRGRRGRNGARSYRPGSRASRSEVWRIAIAAMEPGLIDRDHGTGGVMDDIGGWLPQWSPVLSTGITQTSIARDVARVMAAMEPGLIDRDHPQGTPTRCRSYTCRNGARSYRPGSRPAHCVRPRRSPSRNGARSYRPGSLTQVVDISSRLPLPQWSPVLSTGITVGGGSGGGSTGCRNGARSYRPGSHNGYASLAIYAQAAMEPGLIDRDHTPGW